MSDCCLRSELDYVQDELEDALDAQRTAERDASTAKRALYDLVFWLEHSSGIAPAILRNVFPYEDARTYLETGKINPRPKLKLAA